ncbi:MAG: hypothetical protein EOP09_06940, partial [Proteobacteria bacterium]
MTIQPIPYLETGHSPVSLGVPGMRSLHFSSIKGLFLIAASFGVQNGVAGICDSYIPRDPLLVGQYTARACRVDVLKKDVCTIEWKDGRVLVANPSSVRAPEVSETQYINAENKAGWTLRICAKWHQGWIPLFDSNRCEQMGDVTEYVTFDRTSKQIQVRKIFKEDGRPRKTIDQTASGVCSEVSGDLDSRFAELKNNAVRNLKGDIEIISAVDAASDRVELSA